MEPLTEDEQARLTPLLPILERVAARVARSKKLTRDEARSAGFTGLVKALRTYSPDRGTLEDWAGLCVQNAIRDALKTEIRKAAKKHRLDYDPPDHRQTSPDPRMEKISALPEYLRLTVLAWLEHDGSIAETAKALGKSRAMIADNLEIAKKKLMNMD